MVVAKNKKAYYDYFIEEKYEAGIELKGSEVKSIKLGKASIKEAFIRIIKDEVFIMGMNVTPYEQSSIYTPDQLRVRKLLLHRKEIRKLYEKVSQKGYTIVPLTVYIKKGLVKIEIALARGKKNYDKRETEAKRTQKREMDKAMKSINRY
ncbi:SsrA-binding protein [Hypnocyclicus thermotrophus]|uniref:SsrA-binding protein n=1 Tax=Hypnocyclicus thermotrophus TaxID=1627895 RepID=A0AA46DYS3_9FUSO|nr:SsrA-binding protein SmpB [Hypnocyclicus thermotrophus]TDT70527.1 SsrA-binding protein [Hypnocyclicus thermotrophus]